MAAAASAHLDVMTLSVRSPDELVAAIPHLLGFKPEESIVLVPLRSELPIARVDLPTSTSDSDLVWSSVGSAFSRHAQPGAKVAIVCLTTNRQHADSISQDFAGRLAAIGITTPIRLWADNVDWADLATGESGPQTGLARERLAATTVLAGRSQPATSRDSLASSLVGDREPIAALLSAARAEAVRNTARFERPWAFGRLQQFHADGVRLSDADAARLVVAINSIPIRDTLWNDMTRETATSHVALWSDLTKRAPDDVRAAPASLLGFASWLNGNGAMAWCALDQVPPDRPCPLADLVAAAVQGGMHPREWESAKVPDPQRDTDRDSGLAWQRARFAQDPTRPALGT
ncbi:conserved hypothetical protein [metagenome]|uniref:DUF4192 domain-containing protein n=1 Tax=metagenome TaxID=256318 RepID=A0A2P2BXE4_9ZZZZ